jgi:2-polyprenyl-3-methyl-5-hydroxy-6-metoxy-1,4-benzoquinol methylase
MNSTMKALCPLCGTESTKQRWIKNGTRYFACERCDVVFQFPQPAQERLKEVYAEDYYVKSGGEPCASGYTNYEMDVDLKNTRSVFSPVMALGKGPGKRLLDVGCATGKVLEVARESGWDAIGVEISAWAADAARKKGFQVHAGTLEEVRLEDQSIDVVTLFDVLEHIPDPRRTLREVGRLLRPGGAIVVQTPNANGFGPRILYRAKSMIVQPDAHLILFSPSGLKKMLEEEGFSVIRLGTHSLSDSQLSYVLTLVRRFVKKVLKALNYRVGSLDLTRWIKRKEMTELPQFSFNDVIRVTAVRASSSS